MPMSYSEQLDFSVNDMQAGFRLHRFELLNWGTFDRHIWQIAPAGDNALLTGDIGSGKSTIVDALTTLLVPHHKITYNKAAGAQSRERNLTSYVLGYYKSEKDQDSLSAKAIALRDHSSYSVLLASFHNQGYDQWVTLAQIFWTKPGENIPKRFYLVANQPLTVKEHFADFGGDIKKLRQRLRNTQSMELFDSFSRYAAAFRRQLGIASEQAMALFYQTVSMKAVGNLTEFVRQHMLEIPPVAERIEHLCHEFENLNQAHEAVLRARDQIERLTPIIDNCDRVQILNNTLQHFRSCREALRAYFEHLKTDLLKTRIGRREDELMRLDDRLQLIKEQLSNQRQQMVDLQRAVDDHGGRRLADIDIEIARLGDDRARKQHQSERYQALCRELDLNPRLDEPQFYLTKESTHTRLQEMMQENESLDQRSTDLAIQKQNTKNAHDELNTELESLRARKTNIPYKNLRLREQMCDALGLKEEELPFVGELLQVRTEETKWEGAIERVLRNFGLSLLVPERHYTRVSYYVDRTNLKGRLVYFRVLQDIKAADRSFDPDTLPDKLVLKPDNEFYPWLEARLLRSYDYHCCEDFESFKRQPKALTEHGQIKSSGERHEKDDRHNLHDRSRFILGWSNAEKIQALEEQEQCLHEDISKIIASIQTLGEKKKQQQLVRDKMLELSRFDRFAELEWEPIALQIQQLQDEKHRIEQSSDQLQALQVRLAEVRQQIGGNEQDQSDKNNQRGALAAKIEIDKSALDSAQQIVNELADEQRNRLFTALAPMQEEALADKSISIEGCDNRQQEMRTWLQKHIDSEDQKAKTLREKIIRHMQEYKTAYPVETREVDAGLESADEFRSMYNKLNGEDLPRHEQRFKTMLNEGTINDVALFQSQLEKEREQIERKIDLINKSLSAIDYNKGTYIKLVPDRNQDPEIRQFQQDLRACLGDALAANQDELYTEDKFQQVKTIIERFKGRETLTDLDKRWTAKVTDVRNWFIFSASERWKADDTEREHYSDSAGKSGGQKEKLAYTILASALAYQFGLSFGETRSRSFRFVMIDEAFGRGSDESARYALELFKKLNLQILIVTPLQKIHIIEDYVSTVNFVHNQDGCNSMIRNLTIEQYLEEKAAYQCQ